MIIMLKAWNDYRDEIIIKTNSKKPRRGEIIVAMK